MLQQTEPPALARARPTKTGLRQISPTQWKSGIAAWLGWTFDGLDMHLYTLVALPFVAELLRVSSTTNPTVGRHASIIQAAFLVGWALGGGFFGRIGDRLGRCRALCLTVLTYAVFTGLSFFAQEWWHLLIFRFLAALGIGGEWAVGASLLSETWPKRWRPWIAAVLQSGVNVGVLLAVAANLIMAAQPPRYLFLIGVLPAFLVLWVRRAVPEPDEWHAAKAANTTQAGIADLFRGNIRRTSILVILVCAAGLTGHWAFMFWHQQHLRNLPEVLSWTAEQKNALASKVMYMVMVTSIIGNFASALIAKFIGFRRTITLMSIGYFVVMAATYAVPREQNALFWWLAGPGFFSGGFALFTMYLPALFPTLIRTTGAGFSYNIGRIFAAAGTIVFGLFSAVGDYRLTLLYAGSLFLPMALIAWFLPDMPEEKPLVGRPSD